MAKILFYADPHICTYSSIIRSRSDKYSTRLQHCIDSLNWVHALAESQDCSAIICLGDFFDKESLNSEEIASLSEINWSTSIPTYYIVGNHEMGLNTLEYSSAHLFELIPKSKVIDKPQMLDISDKINIVALPYIVESARVELKEYLKDINRKNPTIVCSHNDIAGMRFGPYESKIGFSISEIEKSGVMFLNGHLHNVNYLGTSRKILNIGNLTGQNFSEDAFNHPHCAYIYDDETSDLVAFENPHAFNFYKLDTSDPNWNDTILENLKQNAVITIKVKESMIGHYRELIKASQNIIESRMIIIPQADTKLDSQADIVQLNYFDKFVEYIHEKLEPSAALEDELNIICGGC